MNKQQSKTNTDFDYLLKFLVIGDSGVGKSALLVRYVDKHFEESFITTIGVDFKQTNIVLDGDTRVRLQIWDTAGQEQYRSIVAAFYRGAHGVVVVFDLTDRTSFEHVRSWLTEVDRFYPAGITRLLVGNKADMIYERKIEKEEAQDLADALGMPYIETSAKDNKCVSEMFERMARLTIQKTPAPQKVP